MDTKDVEDISAYLLFEGTGDSEVDYNPTMYDDVAHEFPRNAVDDDNDDDDAESCSYDGSENTCEIGKLVNGCEPWDVDVIDDDDGDVKKEDEVEDEKEVIVYGTSCCTDDEVEEHRNSGVVDSVPGQELVDEREKNRLFWEACLAS